MKAIIQATQDKLAEVPEIRYIDEDWGQLDSYSPNFPVKWPCVLIDVDRANYSNVGMDKSQVPMNRQMSEYSVTLTIANQRLSNTNQRAPQTQKDKAWSIWDLIESIHGKMQGFRPINMSGKFIRTAHQRVIRDDGVQEYKVTYTSSITDV